MDFFQAQDLFKKMFPGKDIKYEFDELCQRQHDIVYTAGQPNLMHHVENDKVKITVDGQTPIYAPITPHRLSVPWSTMKSLIDLKKDVFIDDDTLKAVAQDTTGTAITNVCQYSGLSADVVNKKIADWKARQPVDQK